MMVETVHKGIRYTLSNENLEVEDKVYPIANGRCLGGDKWILNNIDFRPFMSGFPDDPHVIKDLKHSDYKPYEVRTDKGFSPRECYYKIIKMEEQRELPGRVLKSYEWVEIQKQEKL